MGEYENKSYDGVEWKVLVVKTKAEGLAAIERGEKAVKFASKGCKLKPADATKIGAELRRNTALLFLDLRDNTGIGPEGAKSIADALKANKTLKTLDLTGTGIGPEGAKSIGDSLKVNKTLRNLSLSEVVYSQIRLGDKGAILIADGLKVNSGLYTLNLSDNNIGPKGAESIADSLKVNNTLKTLNLSSNKIGSEGAKAIADMLKVNTSLQTLFSQSLTGVFSSDEECIGDEGAKSIADALKVNKTLQILHLQVNNIGPEGANSIAGALKVNKTLQRLSLVENKIGDKGAVSIADALTVNKTLQVLDLSSNNIGAQGAEPIADALKVNKTLQELDLTRNSIGLEDQVYLAACASFRVGGLNYKDARVKAAEDHGEEARSFGLSPRNVPSEILKRDSKREATKTVAYLQGLLYSEDSIHQLKVLLVGPQQVGKTSLRRALKSKGKTAHPTKHDDAERATISVDIDKITFEPFGDNQKGGEISLWDFGGQEEYYMTHSFFLSNRSLVMVVVDLETFEDTDNSFEESAGKWLRALQMQIFRPKVLLVGTKCDTQTQIQIDAKITALVRRVDELVLRVSHAIAEAAEEKSVGEVDLERLNGFEGLTFTKPQSFAVSGKDVRCADGVENLYNFLRELASNTELGVVLRVPKAFEDLRSVINEKLDKDGAYIQDLNMLQRDSGLEGQEAMFRLALGLMHDLGIILWYEKNDQLCEFVFADPSWVIDIVRQVFRHDLFVRREGPNPKGTLYDLGAPSDLCKLLEEKCVLDEELLRYFPDWKILDEKMFVRCVMLLQQFELMFKLSAPMKSSATTARNRFMVPLFLQDGFLNKKGRTATLPTDSAKRPSRSRAMRQSLGRLRSSLTKSSFVESVVEVDFLTFMPDGLLYRLIARTFRIVDFIKFTADSAESVYRNSNGDTVNIKFKVERKLDGTGKLSISCSGDFVNHEQVQVLERTRTLLSNEFDQLMEDSYQFVPYRLNPSTTQSLSTESMKLPNEGQDFSYFRKKEMAVRMLLKAKDPYRVKKLFFDEIQHLLEMDDQKTEHLVKVGRDIRGKLNKTFQLNESSLVDGDPLKCDSRLFEGKMMNRDDDMSLNDAREFLKLVRRLSTRVRTKYDCFMSHKWGENSTNHEQVKELAGYLSNRGLKCWLDEKCIRDNVSEMLHGVHDSQVFVACITEDYIEDVRKGDLTYCGKEFMEARSKAIDDKIPFFMKEDLADDDVLSLLIGFGKKLYVVRESDLFDRILQQLFPYDDITFRSDLLSMYTYSNEK